MGISAGLLAVLVLAFYIQDAQTPDLYPTPALIWLACPFLLHWILRIWLITLRGHMHIDPITFAICDPASWLTGIVFMSVFALARVLP